MTIEDKIQDAYDDGFAVGLAESKVHYYAEGLTEAMNELVHIMRNIGFTDKEIIDEIHKEFHFNEEQAKQYLS